MMDILERRPVLSGVISTAIVMGTFVYVGLGFPHSFIIGMAVGGTVAGLSTPEFGSMPKTGALHALIVPSVLVIVAVWYLFIQPSTHAVNTESFKLGAEIVLAMTLVAPIAGLVGLASTLAGHELKNHLHARRT